jgi:hypothetical protein
MTFNPRWPGALTPEFVHAASYAADTSRDVSS